MEPAAPGTEDEHSSSMNTQNVRPNVQNSVQPRVQRSARPKAQQRIPRSKGKKSAARRALRESRKRVHQRGILKSGKVDFIFKRKIFRGRSWHYCEWCEGIIFGKLRPHTKSKMHLERMELYGNVPKGMPKEKRKETRIIIAPGEPAPPGVEDVCRPVVQANVVAPNPSYVSPAPVGLFPIHVGMHPASVGLPPAPLKQKPIVAKQMPLVSPVKRQGGNFLNQTNKVEVPKVVAKTVPDEPLPPGVEDDVEREARIQKQIDEHQGPPLVGLEYLIEIYFADSNREPTYLCTLCMKQGHPITIFAHLISYYHVSRYIKVHFPQCFQALSPYIKGHKKIVADTFFKIAKAVETTFSRLKPLCVENGEFNRASILNIVTKRRHFHESPEHNFLELIDYSAFKQIDGPRYPGGDINMEKTPTPQRFYIPNPKLPVPVPKKSPSPPTVAPPRKKLRNVTDTKPTLDRSKPWGSTAKKSNRPTKSSDSSDNEGREPLPPRQRDQSPPLRKKRNYIKRGFEATVPKRQKFDDSELVRKREQYEKLCKAIENDLSKMLKNYDANPEKHPKYSDEWKAFWKKRYKDLQAEGKDPLKHDFKPEWTIIWRKRVMELQQEELKNRKEALRKRLDYPEENSHAPISFQTSSKSESSKPTNNIVPMAARPDEDLEVIVIDDKDDEKKEFIPNRDASSSSDFTMSSEEGIGRGGSRETNRLSIPLVLAKETIKDNIPRRLSRDKSRDLNIRGRSRDNSREMIRRRRSRETSRERMPRNRSKEISKDRNIRGRSRDINRDRIQRGRSKETSRERIRRGRSRETSTDRIRGGRSREISRERIRRERSRKTSRDRFPRGRSRENSRERIQRNRSRESSRERIQRNRSRETSRDRIRRARHSRETSRDRLLRGRSRDRVRRSLSAEIAKGDDRHRKTELDIGIRSEEKLRTIADIPWIEKLKMYGPGFLGVPQQPSVLIRDITQKPVNLTPRFFFEDENEEVNVVSVLRLLTVLEDKLGSLGPRIIQLLTEAVSLEKNKPKSSIELLDDEINAVIFETVKEKLKGQLLADLVDPLQQRLYKEAVRNIAILIHMSSQRKKQIASEESDRRFSVAVPGVGAVDRESVAKQLANALIAQGKTDVTQEQLEQLISAVIGITEASKTDNTPITTSSILTHLSNMQEKATKEKVVTPRLQPHKEKVVISSTVTTEKVTTPISSEKLDRSSNIARLSDSDLQTLLQNFNDLSTDEQISLENYLKKLESTEPERVKKLKEFINFVPFTINDEKTIADKVVLPKRSNSESRTDKETVNDFNDINHYTAISDDEDYNFDDVLKATADNIKKQQIERNSHSSAIYSTATTSTRVKDANCSTAAPSADLVSNLSNINVANLKEIMNNIQTASQSKMQQQSMHVTPQQSMHVTPQQSMHVTPQQNYPQFADQRINPYDSSGLWSEMNAGTSWQPQITADPYFMNPNQFGQSFPEPMPNKKSPHFSKNPPKNPSTAVRANLREINTKSYNANSTKNQPQSASSRQPDKHNLGNDNFKGGNFRQAGPSKNFNRS